MNQTTQKMTAGSAVDSGHLATVNPQTRKLMEKAITANTKRAYQGALSRLDEWLIDRQLDDSSLAEYVQYLHSTGKAPSTRSRRAPGHRSNRPLYPRDYPEAGEVCRG